MTKASKILTVLVAVFCVLYMGTAFMMWTVRTNWKEKAEKEFPKSRITEQQTQIKELNDAITAVDAQHEAAKKAITADVASITAPQTGREAHLESELATLNADATAIAGQVEVEAKKVQAKQDEDKQRRDDVNRLKAQYEEVVAQKHDAEATVKRVRDLLFQAKGVLERVRLRARLLDADEGKGGPYDANETAPAAARLSKTIR